MRFLRKLLARNRIRGARKRLAQDPSPRAYFDLAQEYAKLGLSREVQRTCQEGLAVFPGSRELSRMRERAQRIEREERMAELKRELAEAPRPALWREMCEIMLESGRLSRAEECAEEWNKSSGGDPEAIFTLARVCMDRFFADRGRDQGQHALDAIDQAATLLPHDTRPLYLRLDLLSRIGAWKDARKAAAALLQIEPGNPALEARFRTLDSQSDDSPSINRALIDVERSGNFADERDGDGEASSQTDVRPILRDLAAQPDIQAAIYVRGATALVQGPRGATAERMARTVRAIIAGGRTTGRRLGLGQVFETQMEGDFGTLAIAPGEMDAGALWCTGHLSTQRERSLLELAGINAHIDESESSESEEVSS